MSIRTRSLFANIVSSHVPTPLHLLKTHLNLQTSQSSLILKLRKCSRSNDLDSIYAAAIKMGAHQDSFFANQFVSACSAFRQTTYAVSVFRSMESPNVFVYNALIRGLVHCSSPILAFEFFLQMSRSQVPPSSYTFSSLIKASSQVTDAAQGESIHCLVWKIGFESQVFVQTALIDFYSDFGRTFDARKVFDEMSEKDVVAWTAMIAAYAHANDLFSARKLFNVMPDRSTVSWNTIIAAYARSGDVESAACLFDQVPSKDLVSWTTMISGCSQNKQYKVAIEFFKRMRAVGISPDEVTMSTVISACAHLGALQLGKEIHFYAMQIGFEIDVYIGSALIDMYAKCGSIEKSLVVFFKLREKNLFCWNSIIEGLAIHGYAQDALSMFSRMERDRIKPNGVTFVSVLSACTHAGLVEEGWQRFLSMTSDYSISPKMEHYGCMVDLLGRAGRLNDALDLIKSMEMEPNSVIWGALLGGCKIHGNVGIAEVAVTKLLALEPNNSGYYLLLVNMYAEANCWTEVALTRTMMKGKGVDKKSPGCSSLELGGDVHEFVAGDTSHLLGDDIVSLLLQLDVHLKLSGYSPELVVEFGS